MYSSLVRVYKHKSNEEEERSVGEKITSSFTSVISTFIVRNFMWLTLNFKKDLSESIFLERRRLLQESIAKENSKTGCFIALLHECLTKEHGK